MGQNAFGADQNLVKLQTNYSKEATQKESLFIFYMERWNGLKDMN